LLSVFYNTLEHPLHKQLAENDNNRISAFITFIVGIIVLFGFYGYVYVYSNSSKHPEFNLEVFLLMSIVTIGILCFLSILTLNLGYSFRRDQLMVHVIRKYRFKDETERGKIFDEIYSPFKEEEEDFLPDFYNLFYWLFLISEIFLSIITIIKVIYILITENLFCNCKNIICLLLFIIFFIIFVRKTFKIKKKFFNKYNDKKKHCKAIVLKIETLSITQMESVTQIGQRTVSDTIK